MASGVRSEADPSPAGTVCRERPDADAIQDDLVRGLRREVPHAHDQRAVQTHPDAAYDDLGIGDGSRRAPPERHGFRDPGRPRVRGPIGAGGRQSRERAHHDASYEADCVSVHGFPLKASSFAAETLGSESYALSIEIVNCKSRYRTCAVSRLTN